MCEKKQMEWQEREGTRLRLREGWWGGAGGKERVTERTPVVVCGREQAQSRRQVCTFNATFSACRGQDKAEKGDGQVRRCAGESAHTWRCMRAGGESARCGTRESAAQRRWHACTFQGHAHRPVPMVPRLSREGASAHGPAVGQAIRMSVCVCGREGKEGKEKQEAESVCAWKSWKREGGLR